MNYIFVILGIVVLAFVSFAVTGRKPKAPSPEPTTEQVREATPAEPVRIASAPKPKARRTPVVQPVRYELGRRRGATVPNLVAFRAWHDCFGARG